MAKILHINVSRTTGELPKPQCFPYSKLIQLIIYSGSAEQIFFVFPHGSWKRRKIPSFFLSSNPPPNFVFVIHNNKPLQTDTTSMKRRSFKFHPVCMGTAAGSIFRCKMVLPIAPAFKATPFSWAPVLSFQGRWSRELQNFRASGPHDGPACSSSTGWPPWAPVTSPRPSASTCAQSTSWRHTG